MRFPQSSTIGSRTLSRVPPAKMLRRILAYGRLGGKSTYVTFMNWSNPAEEPTKVLGANKVGECKAQVAREVAGSNRRDLLSRNQYFESHRVFSANPLSCFKGSTLVWTITGPRPIEEVLPGDRVLSQSPNTGELAYKVVQQVTKRDPTPMLRITVGSEEIVSTLGHPFWVVGQRWTMAKHLQRRFTASLGVRPCTYRERRGDSGRHGLV